VDRAQAMMEMQKPQVVPFSAQEQPSALFIDVQPPQPRLFIVGAVHIAAALVTYANVLGFRTVVLDARTAFATPERFAHADELIARWPADALAAQSLDEGSCVVVLTHDEKIDNPALAVPVAREALQVSNQGRYAEAQLEVSRLEERIRFVVEVLKRIRARIGDSLAIGIRVGAQEFRQGGYDIVHAHLEMAMTLAVPAAALALALGIGEQLRPAQILAGGELQGGVQVAGEQVAPAPHQTALGPVEVLQPQRGRTDGVVGLVQTVD